jgi:hypothetical protein
LKGFFDDEQKKTIRELHGNGWTYHEIALYFGKEYNIIVSDDCIRKIIKRHGKANKKKEKLQKVLVLSDLHIPYNRNDILDIVKKHAKEIDTIVLAGDIIDCESISVFKGLGQYDLTTEMVMAHDLLYEIQEATPGIKRIAFFGNHEVRFEKYLASTKGSISDVHSRNILNEIVDGFTVYNHIDGYKDSYGKLDYDVIDDWYYSINDLMICHPQSFSKIQGRTAVSACEYFARNGHYFNAIFVAHTHKMAAQIPNMDKWCYEIGCLCKEMKYMSSGKLTYTPQAYGYGLAVFKDGMFDVNKSKIYALGNDYS